MKKYFILLIPLTIIAFSIPGCYTMVSHPGEEIDNADRDGNCISCHPHYHETYGFSHYYYPDYWSLYPRWGHYYAAPWWWDYYWLEDEYYYDDPYSPRSSRGEKAVRPKSRWQDVDASGHPRITRNPMGSSSSSSSSTGGMSGKTKTENQPDSETKETRTKEKQDDQKSGKRSGRWRSK